ncbi:hypothetical protein K2X40_02080 [Candidatus Babeliales bacterium]|nr:hypothetical protein [Candidatus Babeliales bacterium]
MVTTYALLFLIFLMPNFVQAGLFTDYAKQTPEETIAALEKKQIDAPHDPYINYNLGVAQYKAGNYAQANQNFGRVFKNKKIDEDFRVRAGFNAGNSGYRGTLESLGNGWEEKELDEKLLEQAIAQTKAAIRSYEDVIKLDDEHEPAKHNKKLAEELLKKLEQKKKKQDQDKQDKKDEKKEDKKDEKKDQQDKKDKNDKQDKQDKNDKKDQKKDEQGKQDKDKSDQQDNKDKQDKGDQNEGDKEKSDQKGDQDKDQDDKKDQHDGDKSDEQKEQEQKEREQQEKEQQEKEAQANADKQKEQEAQQAAAQAAQAGEQEKDDEGMQKRGVRALLENLDEDESKKQKGFIVQQVKGGQASERQGQKPW